MKKIIKTSEGKKFPATNEGLQNAVNSLKHLKTVYEWFADAKDHKELMLDKTVSLSWLYKELKGMKTRNNYKKRLSHNDALDAIGYLLKQEEEKKPTDSEILKYDLQNNDRICKSFKDYEEKKYISVRAGIGDEWIIEKEEVVRRNVNEKTKKSRRLI